MSKHQWGYQGSPSLSNPVSQSRNINLPISLSSTPFGAAVVINITGYPCSMLADSITSTKVSYRVYSTDGAWWGGATSVYFICVGK